MANVVRCGTLLGILASSALIGCVDSDTPK
jgi:hypothetical protein